MVTTSYKPRLVKLKIHAEGKQAFTASGEPHRPVHQIRDHSLTRERGKSLIGPIHILGSMTPSETNWPRCKLRH
jgi:hypothetical protein